ncbi:hypothetical protein NA78x_001779 [Anatilimnocola sp. NA78]|uniref:hypothetical protein n=1 Tax=Anatilimnocola sp. NA78 TaxID=3415683 RepID=UPI003CE50E70
MNATAPQIETSCDDLIAEYRDRRMTLLNRAVDWIAAHNCAEDYLCIQATEYGRCGVQITFKSIARLKELLRGRGATLHLNRDWDGYVHGRVDIDGLTFNACELLSECELGEVIL